MVKENHFPNHLWEGICLVHRSVTNLDLTLCMIFQIYTYFNSVYFFFLIYILTRWLLILPVPKTFPRLKLQACASGSSDTSWVSDRSIRVSTWDVSKLIAKKNAKETDISGDFLSGWILPWDSSPFFTNILGFVFWQFSKHQTNKNLSLTGEKYRPTSHGFQNFHMAYLTFHPLVEMWSKVYPQTFVTGS